MPITRRGLLRASVAASSVAFALAVPARRLSAQTRPTLPIPPMLKADADGVIALTAQTGTIRFLPGVETPTYGYNGDYLGPAIRVRRGETATFRVTNALGEDISTHWHGLKIPGKDDGSPYSLIKPGQTVDVRFTIAQPAATCWYHPHVYPTTAELVIKGLAGLFVIDDEEADALPLPSNWGVDDIPLVLQDRRFNADGTVFHRFNLAAVTTGYVGDTMLVNGAAYPVARAARGWVRLRLLNGSNARGYRLAASDNRTLYVIASDGGLLSEPVAVSELPIQAGERYEVLVDCRDGRAFDLMTLPVTQMAMALPPFDTPLAILTIDPTGAEGTGAMPDSLVALPPLVADLPPARFTLEMGMNLDKQGMGAFRDAGLMEMMASGSADPAIVERVRALLYDGPALSLEEQLSANAINGQPFKMGAVPYSTVTGRDERWIISEGTDRMLHPVHIHGCQFRILSLGGKPPPAHMAGWKDMAPISNGQRCEIQIRFDHPAPKATPFMAHCHNLEHEDSGMMTDVSVEEAG